MRTHHPVAYGAVLLFLISGFVACGDVADTPTAPSSFASSSTSSSAVVLDASGSIFNNHGHVAVVTADQIRAGLAVTLDIRGFANHGHMLELTDGDITRLQNRQRVDKDSTLQNNHSHRVTFN